MRDLKKDCLTNRLNNITMKNLFFALVFMLMGTFAFANTTVEETIDLDKIESLISVGDLDLEETEDAFCGFPISFDTQEFGSGSFWYDCTGDTSGNSNLLYQIIMDMFFR